MASTPHRAYGVNEQGQGLDLTTGQPLVAPVLTPEEQWDEQWNLPQYLRNPTTDLSKLNQTQLEDYVKAHDPGGNDLDTILYAYSKWKAGPTGNQAPADIGGPKAAIADAQPVATATQATAADSQLPAAATATTAPADTAIPTVGTAAASTATATQTPTATTMAGNPFTLPEDPTKNLPNAADLGQEQGDYYNSFLKNYAGAPVIQDQLAGKLSDSLVSQLWQQGAERGVAGGSPGSANANAAYMRALGLTSEQLQNQGLTNLNAAYKTASPLDPYGAEKLSLESYVANLNQYGATSRQIMQNDTQIALQKLQASSNMDLEKQREAGNEALAKINNDASMSREEKQLASQLVIAKLNDAGATAREQYGANTEYQIALLRAGQGGGGGGTRGGTGGSSDTGTSGGGYADAVNRLMDAYNSGQQTRAGNQPSFSSIPLTTGQAGSSGSGFTVSASDKTALGLSDAGVTALSNAPASSSSAYVNELRTGGYSVDDQQWANSLLEAGYDPADIAMMLNGQTQPGPVASNNYGWITDPDTGDVSFDWNWMGDTQTETTPPPTNIADNAGWSIDPNTGDVNFNLDWLTGNQTGQEEGQDQGYVYDDGQGGFMDDMGYPVDEYGNPV